MKYDVYPHYWINHLGFLIRKEIVQGFRQAGFRESAEDWAMMLILQADDGLTTGDLSNRTLRDKTTITRMVDKLVDKGLVERRADPDDRRLVRLGLTQAGLHRFGDLAEVARDLIARSVDGIAMEELQAAVGVMAKMAANLKAEKEDDDGL